MLLKCSLCCDMGCQRTNNEDMILLNSSFFRDEEHEEIFELQSSARFAAIVADGMGGHAGGEFASELALQAFDTFLDEISDGLSTEDFISHLNSWVKTTHQMITNKGIELPQYENMGTTLVGLFSYDNRSFWINIGDSRLYRFRNGILKQLSTDHSMRELTGNEEVPSNEIYNSLGAGGNVFADITEVTGQLLDEDIFLICSDGLTDMISDEIIDNILTLSPTPQALVQAAKQSGGKDNISVVLINIVDSENNDEKAEAETIMETVSSTKVEKTHMPRIDKKKIMMRKGNDDL